jgi:hypothetical protein
VNLLWYNAFDYQLPLLAFMIILGFQFWHVKKEQLKLSETSKLLGLRGISAIFWAAMYIFVFKEFNLY